MQVSGERAKARVEMAEIGWVSGMGIVEFRLLIQQFRVPKRSLVGGNSTNLS